MKQGFEVKFYGKIQYLKKFDNVVRCSISAFDYGYVNINTVAFKDTMHLFNNLNDDDWVKGVGRITTNEYKDKKYLQIVVDEIEETIEPDFEKGKRKQAKPKQETTDVDLDIDDEDLPF